MAAPIPALPAIAPMAAPKIGPVEPPIIRSLRPVRSGRAYRTPSAPIRGLVTPALAEALEAVFERFAHEHGFTAERPLEISLARGFKASSRGHGRPARGLRGAWRGSARPRRRAIDGATELLRIGPGAWMRPYS